MIKLKLKQEILQDQLKSFEQERAQGLANTILSFQRVYQDLVDSELLQLFGGSKTSPSTTPEEFSWEDLPRQLIE
ncbi:hypothetical protein N7509_012183 [Penicillium cosmopolitanum]|uniref:Uncharacterized protein n=1 Tax=Penicillium cosmopolitanum TaxID=1131564 RepID=A0A9W9SJW2_9EURO|nr:uncharacterized protein N7509_012183 [Penicillium cosmopolitanum]KAJ5379064.1 hypothetical protein N7509_012183 [Penicillium cosmopolitanum]